MSRFKLNDSTGSIVDMPKGDGDVEHRIFKLDTGSVTSQVSEFKFGNLKQPGKLATEYHVTANAQERLHVRKDSRFMVDPLLKNSVSVDEEKKRRNEEVITAQVEARALKAEEEARVLGYQAGLKQGHLEATQTFQAKADEMVAAIEAFTASCEATKDEIFRANERYLVELIYRMGKMVVLRELATDKDYLMTLVRTLVEKVGAKDNIRLLINSADLAKVSELKSGLEKSFGKLKNVTFETSSTVEGGGCVLETDWNALDASVETQLQAFHDALIGAQKPAPAGAAGET